MSGFERKTISRMNQESKSFSVLAEKLRRPTPDIGLLIKNFPKIYEEITGYESSNSPGHDTAHSIDNLVSAVRMVSQYPHLSDTEAAEIYLSCLLHDLGRYAETQVSNVSSKDLAVLLPAFALRKLSRQFPEISDLLQERVIYSISSGSEPKTGTLTSDIVHQCDREQLMGTPTIFRGLAFDVGIAKRELPIPKKSEFTTKLPFPESELDRYWLVQYEFFMRNVYPPVTPDGDIVVNKNRKENCVILLLALEGKIELAGQVFGPEIGLVVQGVDGVHWTKRPIPGHVFSEAVKEKNEFKARISVKDRKLFDDIGGLVSFTQGAIKTDGVVVPDDFNETITEMLKNCTSQERENYWNILIYALEKRHERRLADIQSLQASAENSQGLTKVVAEILIPELQKREVQLKQSFQTLI